MLVQNTIYKIIYKFFKIILLFYHLLWNCGEFTVLDDAVVISDLPGKYVVNLQ